MTGSRKARQTTISLTVLLAGFVFAVMAKAPAELFVTFASCVCALSGVFVWGNAKEWQAREPKGENGTGSQKEKEQ